MVIKGHQFPRAVHVEATWGRECDKMVFLLDTSHLGHYMSQPNYREQVIFLAVHIPHICHFFTLAKFLENKIYTEKNT